MIWAVFAGCFLGRIGGATTFASAKVKDAIGRIGIFLVTFYFITHPQVDDVDNMCKNGCSWMKKKDRKHFLKSILRINPHSLSTWATTWPLRWVSERKLADFLWFLPSAFSPRNISLVQTNSKFQQTGQDSQILNLSHYKYKQANENSALVPMAKGYIGWIFWLHNNQNMWPYMSCLYIWQIPI